MSDDDIRFGELIKAVEILVAEQKDFKILQKEMDSRTQEVFLWYKEQKEAQKEALKEKQQIQKEVKIFGIKKIFDGLQYVGTLVISGYLLFKN